MWYLDALDKLEIHASDSIAIQGDVKVVAGIRCLEKKWWLITPQYLSQELHFICNLLCFLLKSKL